MRQTLHLGASTGTPEEPKFSMFIEEYLDDQNGFVWMPLELLLSNKPENWQSRSICRLLKGIALPLYGRKNELS